MKSDQNPLPCQKIHQLIFEKHTVLCVDDDPDDREMVCSVIKDIDPSFNILIAENGQQAHKLLLDAKSKGRFPCLVILDINMPVMDGKETLIKLKEDKVLSKIPVAMFTTSSSEADKNFFKQHGVELFTKPNNMHSIMSEVGKLLNYCAE